MTATNDFQPFGTGGSANVLSQAAYLALASTLIANGFSSGEALSIQVNKVLRQAIFPGAALAQLMCDTLGTNISDDGNLAEFEGNLAKVIRGLAGYASDTGAANAYVMTLAPAPAAYAAGQEFTFKAANACSGAATLNVNALGAKSIVHPDESALNSGDIIAGQMVTVRYDGTAFQMLSTARSVGNYQNEISNTAVTVTLTAAQAGSTVYLSNVTTAQTCNLPAANSVAPGGAFMISAYAFGATLVAHGADFIDTRYTTLSGSVTLNGFEETLLVSNGIDRWLVTLGTAQLRLTSPAPGAPFGCAIASSGFQRLPTGLIFQWGVNTATSTPTTFSFPLTFPTGCYGMTTSGNGMTASWEFAKNASIVSASQFQLYTAGGSEACSWIAIGH